MRLLLDTRFRAAMVAVIAIGVGLALTGAVAALVHRQLIQVTVYVVVALALSGAATAVWRRVRWVAIVCMVALAGQCTAIAGTVWELSGPIAPAKVRDLQLIGFQPTAAVIVNLIYSTLGFAVFCWYATAWLAARRHRHT